MTGKSNMLRITLYFGSLVGLFFLTLFTTTHPAISVWLGDVRWFLLLGALGSAVFAMLYSRADEAKRKWCKSFVDLIWNIWSFIAAIFLFYTVTNQAPPGITAPWVLDLSGILSKPGAAIQTAWFTIITLAAAGRVGIALAESFPKRDRTASDQPPMSGPGKMLVGHDDGSLV